MRRISLWVTTGMVICIGLGCKQEDKMPGLLVRQPVVDLLEINFDSTYTIAYSLLNKGNADLVIDTVTASCGCTVPSLREKVIRPHDSTVLIVDYKPVDTGYFDKKVVIKTNTTDRFSIVSFKGRALKKIGSID